METKKIEIEVPKNVADFADGVGKLVTDVYATLKDGFDPKVDIAAILGALMADLGPAFSNFNKMGDELKEDKVMCMVAFAMAGLKFYETAIKPA